MVDARGALLISAGLPSGGYAAALGAFLVTGVLIALAGLWGRLGRWVAAIPPALASAMLAGVLLTVCLAPVRAAVELPLQAGPVILAWALLMRFARPWAVPGALVVAAVAIAADPREATGSTQLLPDADVHRPGARRGGAAVARAARCSW